MTLDSTSKPDLASFTDSALNLHSWSHEGQRWQQPV